MAIGNRNRTDETVINSDQDTRHRSWTFTRRHKNPDCARNQVDPWTESVWRSVQVVRPDMVASSGWRSEWVEGPGRRISNRECAFVMCPRVRHSRHNIDTATVA